LRLQQIWADAALDLCGSPAVQPLRAPVPVPDPAVQVERDDGIVGEVVGETKKEWSTTAKRTERRNAGRKPLTRESSVMTIRNRKPVGAESNLIHRLTRVAATRAARPSANVPAIRIAAPVTRRITVHRPVATNPTRGPLRHGACGASVRPTRSGGSSAAVWSRRRPRGAGPTGGPGLRSRRERQRAPVWGDPTQIGRRNGSSREPRARFEIAGAARSCPEGSSRGWSRTWLTS
jgi:hypothetical protein